jgi:hypothetical protein
VRTIEQLLAEALQQNKLNVLVFGPALDRNPENDFVAELQRKRRDIRAALEQDGHDVRYGEEVVKPDLPPPTDNPLLQELLLMRAFDLIVVLVHTPGTIAEATCVALRPELAPKAHLFICEEHRGGLAWNACRLAEQQGAALNEFTFPTDLRDCHLLTRVLERARKIQVGKVLS